MKRLLPILVLLFSASPIAAQDAPAKSTPFTAVKWLQYNPYVLVNNEWYLLVLVENTDAKTIVDFCKAKYANTWQKRFSEDFTDVLTDMGKAPKASIRLKLLKDGKLFDKTLAMTAENRRKVLQYNNENVLTGESKTTAEITEQVQKDIAGFVNNKNEKIYPFKSARFKFIKTGHKLFAGNETVYIDDYGKTVVIVTEKNTVIWRANRCTTINHQKKTYFTSPIRAKITEPPTITFSTHNQRVQAGYKKKANETLIGKTCEVYEHPKMKVTYWLWKGFELKIINYSLGNEMGYVKMPGLAEENIAIPESTFNIPAGYKKQ